MIDLKKEDYDIHTTSHLHPIYDENEVNKKAESISEYSPIEDPEEFKKALDHEVYSGKE